MTVVVLDLDDTLYLERDYLLSGIAHLSAWIMDRFAVGGFDRVAVGLLDGRHDGKLFDSALHRLGIHPEPALIADMMARYRAHWPTITLAPDALRFLGLVRGQPMALVSDGHLLVQQRKVAALGLSGFGIDPIICTDQWGRDYWKPHPRAFEVIAARWRGADFVYVADNPAKDFLAPRALGWRTVQIDRIGAVHHREPPTERHAADRRIRSFDDLGADPLAHLSGRCATPVEPVNG